MAQFNDSRSTSHFFKQEVDLSTRNLWIPLSGLSMPASSVSTNTEFKPIFRFFRSRPWHHVHTTDIIQMRLVIRKGAKRSLYEACPVGTMYWGLSHQRWREG